MDDYIAVGYYATNPVPRPKGISERVPAKMLTLSNCFATIGPQDVINWTGGAWSRKHHAAALTLGISVAAIPEMTEWLDAELQPDAFASLDAAREFMRRFAPASEALLIGLGLHRSLLPSMHEQRDNDTNRGYPILERVEQGSALASGGRILGYEALGFDGCSFHTWLCNVSPEEVSNELGVVANDRGFFETLEDGIRVVEYVRKPGGEPAIWEPLLVVHYPICSSVDF